MSMTDDCVPVDGISVHAFDVPVDGPDGREQDGTLTWSSVTLVLVEAHGGGQTGLGYTYADVSAAALAESTLAGAVTGADVFAPGATWRSMFTQLRNAGQPGAGAMAASAVDIAWFGGVLAVIAGFLLQAAALANGQLSVVEPILVFELPVTFVLASRVFGSRLHRREWGAAAAMTAGLAGLLALRSPSPGQPLSVRWYGWLLGIGINVGFVAVMVGWGRRGPAGRNPRPGQSSARQAAVLAVAAGATFGLTAALIKAMTANLSRGFGALLTSWQLYAMTCSPALSRRAGQRIGCTDSLVAAPSAVACPASRCRCGTTVYLGSAADANPAW